MTPHPKPLPPEKAPRPLRRGNPPQRKTRPKFGNAYTRPEWRKKVRRIRQRSRGTCEARVCCDGAPVVGDPHHPYYLDFVGWQRLMIPDEDLIDCCRACHLWYESQKEG